MDKKVRALNAIQQERAGKFASGEEDLQALIDAMASQGRIPSGFTGRTARKWPCEDGSRVSFWFDRSANTWRLRKSRNDAILFETSGTLEQVISEWESHDQDARDSKSPETQAVLQWFTTPHGQEYESIACANAWGMLQDEMRRLGFKGLSVEGLEKAYVSVVDNPDRNLNFDRFFAKRDRIAREQAELQKTQAYQSLHASAVESELQPTPEQREDYRREELRYLKGVDLKRLRRMAIPRLNPSRRTKQ